MTTRPSTSRFSVSTLVILGVIVWSASGCKPPDRQDGPREKITIAYTTAPDAVLVQIAFAKRFFAEEGLDAAPQPHAFGKLALESLLKGKADLATVGDTPFVFAVMNGRKVSAVAAILASNRNNAVVARRDRGIENPSDLLGKRIGVTFGTTGDFFDYSFLLYHGIRENQVRRIGMDPGDMDEALGTGKVDAVSTWSPFRQRILKKLGSNGVEFFGEELYTEAYVVAGTREYFGGHPGTVRKVLRALLKAETFVNRHPGESRRLVAEFTGTERPDLEEAWEAFTFKVSLGQALLVNFEDQTRWVMKNRKAARTEMPNYLEFIDERGLRAVAPGDVDIVRPGKGR
jgi:ABC-type nitrate/sulfonate/bicarbonate transport system substrate-binding protein